MVELMVVTDDGLLDSKAYERISPRFWAVAENWESTTKEWFGWRKMALDIATATDYAAEHQDIVLLNSA